jgi:hypothetical protein
MPQWMQDLTAGWPMIRANLPTFIVLAALMFGAIWWLMEWRYGGIISGRDSIIANKDSEIILYKGQRDDYKDKLSGATPEQAKARIDALETRLARLEPRRLTEAQRVEFAARVRAPVGSIYSVAVIRDISCAECIQLAADISAAFGAGWNVSNPMAMGITNMPPHGIAVRCMDIANPSPEARLVIEAMRAAGIPFDLQIGAQPPRPSSFGPPAPTVEIVVTTPVLN